MATYFQALVTDSGVTCRTVEEDVETYLGILDPIEQVTEFHALAIAFCRKFKEYVLRDIYDPYNYIIEVTDAAISPEALLDQVESPLTDYTGIFLES